MPQMISFSDYVLTYRATNPGAVDPALVAQYENFIKYTTSQLTAQGGGAPSNQVLIQAWANAHNVENKSITSLTIAQFEMRVRAIVREELRLAD